MGLGAPSKAARALSCRVPQGTIEGKRPRTGPGTRPTANSARSASSKASGAIIRNAALGEFGGLPGQATTAPGEETRPTTPLSAFVQGQAAARHRIATDPRRDRRGPRFRPGPLRARSASSTRGNPNSVPIESIPTKLSSAITWWSRQIAGLKDRGLPESRRAHDSQGTSAAANAAPWNTVPGAKGSRHGGTTHRVGPGRGPSTRMPDIRPPTPRARARDRSGEVESTIEIAWTGEVLIEPLTPPTSQQVAASKDAQTHPTSKSRATRSKSWTPNEAESPAVPSNTTWKPGRDG